MTTTLLLHLTSEEAREINDILSAENWDATLERTFRSFATFSYVKNRPVQTYTFTSACEHAAMYVAIRWSEQLKQITRTKPL